MLSGDDQCELGRLLELVDQLTILKTRARYTLRHLGMGTARKRSVDWDGGVIGFIVAKKQRVKEAEG